MNPVQTIAVLAVLATIAIATLAMQAEAVPRPPGLSGSIAVFGQVGTDHLLLAKTIRPVFNAAARGVARPQVARPAPPRPKPPISRPAPTARSFAPRGRPTRGNSVVSRPPRPVAQRTRIARTGNVARAGRPYQARARMGAAFRAQAGRGALRAGFRRAASPAVRSARIRGSTMRSSRAGLRLARTLRPTFQRALLKSKAARAFRRANSYAGARGPVTWRLTKPGEIFYRSHSGVVSGAYSTPVRPTNLRNARSRNALPPSNKAYRLSRFVGTGRELVGVSRVARNFGWPGGGTQAYFPKVPTFTPAGWNRGALTEIFTNAR